MNDDNLNRLCAQAMALGPEHDWKAVLSEDGPGLAWEVRNLGPVPENAHPTVCAIDTLNAYYGEPVAAYLAAVSPSTVIAMVRRIRELEYQLAKANYKVECSWLDRACENYGPLADPTGRMKEACDEAKAAVDDAAARLSAVGGRP